MYKLPEQWVRIWTRDSHLYMDVDIDHWDYLVDVLRDYVKGGSNALVHVIGLGGGQEVVQLRDIETMQIMSVESVAGAARAQQLMDNINDGARLEVKEWGID